jgi:hypothetical protein
MFFILVTIAFIALLFYYDYDRVVFPHIRKFKNYFKSATGDPKENQLKTDINTEWSYEFEGFGTESCIRLYDVDEDGLDDIIFGAAGNFSNQNLIYKKVLTYFNKKRRTRNLRLSRQK